jgi:hypothetical protein
MMLYIELLNFEKVLPKVELKLCQKIRELHVRGSSIAIWQENNQQHPGEPDLTLIYAPRLSFNAMESFINQAKSKITILYAAMRPMANATLIHSFNELDAIVSQLPEQNIFVTNEFAQCLVDDSSHWKKTVSLGLI